MNLKKLRQELQAVHRSCLQWALANEDTEYAVTMNRMFALIDRIEKELEEDEE